MPPKDSQGLRVTADCWRRLWAAERAGAQTPTWCYQGARRIVAQGTHNRDGKGDRVPGRLRSPSSLGLFQQHRPNSDKGTSEFLHCTICRRMPFRGS